MVDLDLANEVKEMTEKGTMKETPNNILKLMELLKQVSTEDEPPTDRERKGRSGDRSTGTPQGCLRPYQPPPHAGPYRGRQGDSGEN